MSMNTFVFGVFATGFSYFNGVIDVFQSLLLMSICLMQLIEFFIWRNIDNKSKNEFYSNMAIVLLMSQPLFSISTIANKKIKVAAFVIYMAYIVIFALYKLQNKPNKRNVTTIGRNKHLKWNWISADIYKILIYVVFLIAPLLLWDDKFIGIVVSITLILSFVLFAKDGTWGSMWCWTSNIISIYLIYLVFKKEICKC